jgi:hypothetical protein
MRLLLHSDKPLNEAPRSTWQPYKHKGRGTVALGARPAGTRSAFRTIGSTMTVSSSEW